VGQSVANIPKVRDTAEYAIRRLRKDRPDIHARLSSTSLFLCQRRQEIL